MTSDLTDRPVVAHRSDAAPLRGRVVDADADTLVVEFDHDVVAVDRADVATVPGDGRPVHLRYDALD